MFLCCALAVYFANAQTARTVDCTAGELETLLSPEERKTITELTISGSVDVRDIYFFRDSISALNSIDLKNATIAEFTGEINGSKFTVFPENQLPFNTLGGRIEHIILPDNLESFAEFALTGAAITEIEIPESVEFIAPHAFINSKLKSVTIPSNVQSIQNNAFYDCDSLQSVTIEDGLEHIGAYAFAYCDSLKHVKFPNSLCRIDPCAFFYSGLDEVEINTLRNLSIGQEAFYCCKNIKEINITSAEAGYIGEFTFYSCNSSTKATIKGVTYIGKYAFYDNSSMTELSIDSSLRFIAENGFYYCTSLETITLEDGLEVISDYAFEHCPWSKTVTLPQTVKYVGSGTFRHARSETIILPNSIEKFGLGCFDANEDLIKIYSFSATPVHLPESDIMLYGNDTASLTIYVPHGSKALYDTASQWKDFKIREMEISSSVEEIVLEDNDETAALTIESNAPWHAYCDADWVTITPSSGIGKETISILAQPNESEEERTAILRVEISQNVRIKSSASVITARITQKGKQQELTGIASREEIGIITPVPADDFISVGEDDAFVKLYSPTGKLVLASFIESGSLQSVSHIAEGIYEAVIETVDGSYHQKIVIK